MGKIQEPEFKELMHMEVVVQKDIVLPALVSALIEGQTLVYPTETCYGLGCDATNMQAVEKIFAIKNRPDTKSLILLVRDLDMLAEYTTITSTVRELSERYWPGPLTVIVPLISPKNLAPGVIASDRTIACRISSHPLASTLVATLGCPLVSTSANLAGHQSPYNILEILSQFSDHEAQPDIVIDAGDLPRRKPSTVVRLVGDRIETVREGEIQF